MNSHYLADFEAFSKAHADRLAPIRAAAMEAFQRRGFPGTDEEEWRKTSVAPLARIPFRPAGTAAAPPPEAVAFDAPRLVFLNGRPVGVPPAIPGVRITSPAAAAPQTLAALTSLADWQLDPFTALNTAFLADGAVIEVEEGADAGALHLHFATRADAPVVTHPRVLVVAGRGSRLSLVESFAGEGPYFTNTVTEIVAGERSRVEHCRLQRESPAAYHIGSTRVRLAREARYDSHAIALGALLSRHDLGVAFTGPGGACSLDGLYAAGERRLADNHTTIDHAAPHCESRELYKGVLSGQARAVFNGRVIVRPEASGTDSRQVNRNLLLSDEALVDTKPELQIQNNDVKCTHAATIGQLDETALFYMRARGLDRDAARALLVRAFTGEVIGRIVPAPLREAIAQAIGGSEGPR